MERCWSTSGVSGVRAISAWVGILHEAMYELDVSSPYPDAFTAQLVQRRLGTLSLNAVRCEQHDVVRSRSMAARDPSDKILLVYATSGSFRVEQEGRIAHAQIGDAVLLDARSAFCASTSSGFN